MIVKTNNSKSVLNRRYLSALVENVKHSYLSFKLFEGWTLVLFWHLASAHFHPSCQPLKVFRMLVLYMPEVLSDIGYPPAATMMLFLLR